MNSSSSSTSAHSGISARMRSMACEVFELGARQQAQRGLQVLDGVAREAAPLQADAVGAEHLDLALAYGVRKRQHVLRHHAVSADEGVPPDAAELVHAGGGADHRPVPHRHVPAQRDGVGQHHVIADVHIVRHVRVGHQQVVVADAGDQAAALGAAMDGDEFADVVAVADARFGALAVVFQVLRGHAHGAVREKDVVLADAQRALPGRRGPSGACRRRFRLRRRRCEYGPISALSAMRARGSTIAVG